jgi:hypothetical protein
LKTSFHHSSPSTTAFHALRSMKAKTPFALLTEKKLRTGIVKPQMSQIKQILGCAMFSRDELTTSLSPPGRWFLPP